MESDSLCLRLLQVVREVLQVLANPQVLECHLFQLGLEVLSLPIYHFFFQNKTACSQPLLSLLSVGFSNVFHVMFLLVRLSLQRGLEVLEVQGVRGDLLVRLGQQGHAHQENPTAPAHRKN